MKTRIYITEEILNPGRLPVLVEAATMAQAARHVADRMFVTRVATTREVADLVGAGHRVAVAGEIMLPPDETAARLIRALRAPSADTGAHLPASKAGEESDAG